MKSYRKKQLQILKAEKALAFDSTERAESGYLSRSKQSRSYFLKIVNYGQKEEFTRVFNKNFNYYINKNSTTKSKLNLIVFIRRKTTLLDQRTLADKFTSFKPERLQIRKLSYFKGKFFDIKCLFPPIIRVVQKSVKKLSMNRLSFTSNQLSVLFANISQCQSVDLEDCMLDTFKIKHRQKEKYCLKSLRVFSCIDKKEDEILQTHEIFYLVLKWMSYPKLLKKLEEFTYSGKECEVLDLFVSNMKDDLGICDIKFNLEYKFAEY
ncbi:unnamed protein product [Moneuplotes crassus]|uniref:Uncharacterized protein n=1 Tax=Euplotes crassus TaxID=5936 RepID=A0AAD1XR53_EUPCR|nr:unnamed protein product [Moneuplotes crassus]